MFGDWFQGHGPDGPNAQGGSSTNALVTYGNRTRSPSGESTPLLPGKAQRRISSGRIKFIMLCLVMLGALLFDVVSLILHFTKCPLYPSTMNNVRLGWQKEEAQHTLVREEWRLEEQNHTVTLNKWKLETEWHDRDVVRRIQEENERQARVKREWAREYERHMREVEEYEETVARKVREEAERQEKVRKEWDKETQEREKEIARRVHEEEEHREEVRQRWTREVEKHDEEVVRRIHEEEERQQGVRRKWDEEAEQHQHECEEMERHENQQRENEREKWRREVENHDQIVEERRKREEEERQKLNMFWGGVETRTCTSYATREYTAQLMNLPTTWEHRVEACKAIPLEVHGVSYLPKSCEDGGPGVVIGRWEINQHEPECASYWNWYKDKGCTSPGSGKRRIEHYLENLPRGGDWREFCATTPARFNGLEFSGAQECFQHNLGTYGHWEIDDANCLPE